MTGSKQRSFDLTLPSESVIDAKEGRPEPDLETSVNGDLVEKLAQVARYDINGLGAGPMRLWMVLERDAWRKFGDPHTHKIYEYGANEFEKFVVALIPGGLEVKGGIPALLRICAGDGEYAIKARAKIRELTPVAADEHARPGNQNARKKEPENANSNTTPVSQERGSTYALRRLKRDRPDLAAKVVAGEMSAHAAAVEAGIRQRMVQCPATVEGFRRAVERTLSAIDRQALKEQL